MVVSGVQVATFKEQLGARGAVECVSSYVVVCKWLYGGVPNPGWGFGIGDFGI